ncbi:uncharacterized protein LOC129411842 [Boleophthalmus pectinirostris]|uniref:uncharacterized protein LOC129411842 n=1 Tax=Boleophthalmus pectinirostris TaxID=150288 RepID=UPI00242AD871|nr:uncharacterized protein LOC129411842 [Boleophthalmus pectinirostris]
MCLVQAVERQAVKTVRTHDLQGGRRGRGRGGGTVGLFKPQQNLHQETHRKQDKMTKLGLRASLVVAGCWVLCAADVSPADLNTLYNSPVKTAEWVIRPKQGIWDWVPDMYPTTHSGVRVTLEDGRQFLIHKGRDFGILSETVVTDAKHMSDKWEVKLRRGFMGSVTVGDLVKAGGEKYTIMLGEHCHKAAKDMMNLNIEEDETVKPCVFLHP